MRLQVRWGRSRTAMVVVATAVSAGAAAPAQATYVSSVIASTAIFTGDAAGDTLRISASGGLLRHNRFDAGDPGFASAADWNSFAAGVQTVPATAATTVAVAADNGSDTVVSEVDGPALRIDGGAGSDVFEVLPGASVGSGYLDGGPDVDRLDYHRSASGVDAALASIASATLRGSAVVPPTASSAQGTVRVEVDQRTGALHADLTATANDVTAAQLHAPAPVGANAPVLFNFGCTSPAIATGCSIDQVETVAQRADFASGLHYVVVRTAVFPSGAIRAQLLPPAGVAPGVGVAGQLEDLEGGSGDDVLRGTHPANVLTGNGGADTFDAGGGNDLLLASGDGFADIVGCGRGDDVVSADPADLVAGDCEHVTRVVPGAPGPSPDPGPSAPPAAVPALPPIPPLQPPAPLPAPDRSKPTASFTVAARQRRATLLGGAFTLRARANEPVRLAATLEVGASTARRLGLTRSPSSAAFILARSSGRLPAAGARAMRFTLDKSPRGKLRRVRRLTVTVRLSATDAAGNVGTAASRRVTFVAS